ncbi:MAG: reductive dehalogenase [Deltaproteobacteria bacterium]|nr:reductive dehalogenase [Deltaproteobacteria bacterium]MBW2342290.1 reductive dehalogenase [Deltaproteobacteria bacterium]
MVNSLLIIAALALIVQAFIGLTYLISSIWEKEKRASIFAGLQFLGMLGLVIAFFYLVEGGFFETPTGLALLIAGVSVGAIGIFLLVRKTKPNQRALKGTAGLTVGEVKRYDQRQHVFGRNRSIRPGSEQYRRFYREHPEMEECDAKRREMGLTLGQHPGAIDGPYGRANVAATFAFWSIPIYLQSPKKVKPQAHPELRGKKVSLSPEEATERVEGYTRSIGADLVGIAEINPVWVYSHRGEIYYDNWEDWGKEIDIAHRYAVVFAMEMSFDMVGAGPHTPTVMESMQNYAKGAYISTQLASFIANLGYSATANHLRHYEALMVPLAVDAGLGELGRLGYLVTKEFGPRVRLGAVTTELPLIPDRPVDIGVEDFCRICKKCALCCPSNAIPLGDQAEVNGSFRWKLNAKSCFDYWAKIGTDCNICMRVCPWSHARTFPHKVIVKLIIRNSIARRLFSVMDDIFYGKKPRPKPGPRWAGFNAGQSG